MLGDISRVGIVLASLALLAFPQVLPSFASTISWDGGGDGTDWFDPDNWDSDSLPLNSDDITIGGNASVDLSDQFLLTSGSLTVEAGSSLFMSEDSPALILGVGGLLTNHGLITVSNEMEITGTMINNGNVTIQMDFEDANPQIYVVEEQGTLLNNGNILVSPNAGLENYNILTNLGNVTISSDARYQNGYNTTNGATFIVREGGAATNDFNFTNNGSIVVEGRFTGQGSQVILTNSGTIENVASGFFGMGSDSTYENIGSLVNSGDAFLSLTENSGLILNSETMEIAGTVSSSGNFTNNGIIDLSGEIQVVDGGFFGNSGQITMGKDFGGEGTVEGRISNGATFDNSDSIEVGIGIIANTGVLTNSGTITNQDLIDNSGNGRIRNTGTIDNNSVISNNGNGRITNIGTINNNDTIDNQNVIDDCGTMTGNAPIGGTVNAFCPATITILKDTVPNSTTDFSFSSTTLTPAAFSLDDDGQGPLQNTQIFEDLAPGLYNVTEAFSSSYITNTNCNDGSLVSSIDAGNDESVTCTFTNLLDSDLDGLESLIDTNSIAFSNNFDDAPLGSGGATNGTITDRKSLAVWVTDEPNPSGVKIRAVNGPSQNATISVCSGASTLSLNEGDGVIVTCGSVDLASVSGSPLALFNSQGIRSSVVLPEGNGIFFEPSSFRFAVPPNNPSPLPIEIEAATKITVELPQNEQNSFSFEPATVTFTSDASNQGQITVIIGDKEATIPPDSSISPLIVPDQSVTVNENQQIEIILSSLGGSGGSDVAFEVVGNPLGQLVQDEYDSSIMRYTPSSGFAGTDQFTFRAIQGAETSNVGTVTIKVLEDANLVKQKILGSYVGKFDDPGFAASGVFKVGKGSFKRVSVEGTFDTAGNGAKCFDVSGRGVMDFKKGNTVNIEFSAETCRAKIISKTEGVITFAGGTGIFEGAEGAAEFSQVNARNSLAGKLNGNIFLKAP